MKLPGIEDPRILPSIGRVTRSVSILNKTTKTWTNMSETETAQAHMIDDDDNDNISGNITTTTTDVMHVVTTTSASSKSQCSYTQNSSSSKSLLSNPQTMTFGSNTQPLPPVSTKRKTITPSPIVMNRQTNPVSTTTPNSTNPTNPTNKKSKSNRILVVDDSPMCQRILIRMLQKHGFEVDTADNGVEAIEKLSIEPCLYHACLMDLR